MIFSKTKISHLHINKEFLEQYKWLESGTTQHICFETLQYLENGNSFYYCNTVGKIKKIKSKSKSDYFGSPEK